MDLSLPRQGKYDRPIELWSPEHGQWIPSWFSYLRAGQFFLDPILGKMEASKCYMCTSNVKAIPHRGEPSFVVQGLEIVQAPVKEVIDESTIDVCMRVVDSTSRYINDSERTIEALPSPRHTEGR